MLISAAMEHVTDQRVFQFRELGGVLEKTRHDLILRAQRVVDVGLQSVDVVVRACRTNAAPSADTFGNRVHALRAAPSDRKDTQHSRAVQHPGLSDGPKVIFLPAQESRNGQGILVRKGTSESCNFDIRKVTDLRPLSMGWKA